MECPGLYASGMIRCLYMTISTGMRNWKQVILVLIDKQDKSFYLDFYVDVADFILNQVDGIQKISTLMPKVG